MSCFLSVSKPDKMCLLILLILSVSAVPAMAQEPSSDGDIRHWCQSCGYEGTGWLYRGLQDGVANGWGMRPLWDCPGCGTTAQFGAIGTPSFGGSGSGNIRPFFERYDSRLHR